MKKLIVIGDADGLIAFINPTDANNQKAAQILSFLEEHQAILSFPTTTIAEAITALQRKHASPPLAQQVIEHCKEGNILFTSVDDIVMEVAFAIYNPHGSKQNTFFDAIVAAVAKQQQADAIFSFDGWYKKLGFTLAEALLEEQEQAA